MRAKNNLTGITFGIRPIWRISSLSSSSLGFRDEMLDVYFFIFAIFEMTTETAGS